MSLTDGSIERAKTGIPECNGTVFNYTTMTHLLRVGGDRDYKIWVTVEDKAGNRNITNASFTTALQSTSTGGGAGQEVVYIGITKNNTYCGDGICQREGNDLGIKEDWANCPQDCKAFDFDALIFSLTSNCFDGDSSTSCFWWDILFKWMIDAFESSGGFNVDTLYTNCFNEDKSDICFYNTNLFIYVLLGLFVVILIFSMVKIRQPGSKSPISITRYIRLKSKRRKRR